MKKIFKIYVIRALFVMCVAVMMVGCRGTELLGGDTVNDDVKILSDGRLGVSVQFEMPVQDIIDTRLTVDPSTEEKNINNVWIIVFDDATGVTKQLLQGTYDTVRKKIYAEFTPYSLKVKLYYLVNVSTDLENDINSITNISAFLDLTQNKSVLSSTAYPMSSELVVLSSISTDTMRGLIVNMGLSYARIDIMLEDSVKGDGINSGFKFSGAFIVNSPLQGYVLPHSSLPINLGGTPTATVEKLATNNVLTGLYLFENNGAKLSQSQGTNPTDLIIRGQRIGYPEGFYKLRLKYTYNANTSYDVRRNVLYEVKLTNIKSPGYLTLQEAMNNAPSNIEYNTIVVNPENANIVTNNGEYYINFTNSDCDIFADGGLNNVVVSKFIFNKNPEASLLDFTNITKSVTAVGDGLSVINTSFDPTKSNDIVVSITSAFVKGSLIIRLGNITKTININRKPACAATEIILTDYSKEFSAAQLLNYSDASWLLLGSSSGSCASQGSIINLSGIYIKLIYNRQNEM